MAVRISVVVASRGRAGWLGRCLHALTLQDHAEVEVILVADPAGLAVRPDLPIRRIPFDRANLSQARNLGLAQAAGAVVAFIDDDAVAEPSWAGALAGAFADPRVIAATGPVLGPDGIRWQAGAEWLDGDGPRALDDHDARLWFPRAGGTLSTIGTNCAFRRAALRAVAGFDPAFAFHLDESDLNLRLAATFPHRPTAFVPQARVIHAAASGTTRAHGAPADLAPIGRSEALFARRHHASAGWKQRLRQREHARLLRAMLAGRLDPLHLRRVMAGLDRGLADAEYAENAPEPAFIRDICPAFTRFLHFDVQSGRHRLISGWHWHAGRLRTMAARAAKAGDRVSVMLWSPSAQPHREGFVDGGWWERRGGIWGPGRAGDPPVILASRNRRLRDIADFWAQTRGPLGGDGSAGAGRGA